MPKGTQKQLSRMFAFLDVFTSGNINRQEEAPKTPQRDRFFANNEPHPQSSQEVSRRVSKTRLEPKSQHDCVGSIAIYKQIIRLNERQDLIRQSVVLDHKEGQEDQTGLEGKDSTTVDEAP